MNAAARRMINGHNLQFRVNPSGLSIFQSVGGHIWPASDFLVDYMVSTNLVRGKTVLELGSGCGYIGIASAVLGASKSTMTDMLVNDSKNNTTSRIVLDNCDHNIALNSGLLTQENVETQVLHWGKDHKKCVDKLMCKSTGDVHYDLILGSDVTYEAEGSDSLFWTISYILRRQQDANPSSTCRCILSHEYRMDETTNMVLGNARNVGLKHAELCRSNQTAGHERQFVLWEMMLA
jgi:hypothetical protein